jgi:DNA mismatch endonuclease (patch repair protein)
VPRIQRVHILSRGRNERSDNLTPLQRHRTMQAVKSTGTGPEHRAARALRGLGVVFRAFPKLPGSPDFLLPNLRAVMFVHGCFWHGHGCRNVSPRTNRTYWRNKLLRNRHRDRRVRRELNRLGWTVLIVWECRVARGIELASISRAIRRARRFDAAGSRWRQRHKPLRRA